MSSPDFLDQQQLLKCIADILEDILSETDQCHSPQDSAFHSSKRPSISIANYLQRIARYSGCSDQCYVIALIYIDRLQSLNPGLVVNSLCIHRFLLAAIMIAIKWHDDIYYKNDFYAKLGGISAKDINLLEQQFLQLTNFKLFVDQNIYENYAQKLFQQIEV